MIGRRVGQRSASGNDGFLPSRGPKRKRRRPRFKIFCARHPDMGLCMGVELVAVGVWKWMMGTTTELAGEVGDSDRNEDARRSGGREQQWTVSTVYFRRCNYLP